MPIFSKIVLWNLAGSSIVQGPPAFLDTQSTKQFLHNGRVCCVVIFCVAITGIFQLKCWCMHSFHSLFFTRGQLWPSGIVVACVCLCVCACVCVRQSSVCPDDNLSPAQATITKFGPEVQNTLIKIPIVFGVQQPWPSRSNWT